MQLFTFSRRLLFAFGFVGCLTCTISTYAQSGKEVSGGIFIQRNGGYEGKLGKAHLFFKEREGGLIKVVGGSWPDLTSQATLELVFEIKKSKGERPVEIRQSFDQRPQILFLEEGKERIGLRVLFKLYGSDNIYYGHAMTETWVYPNGEMYISAGAKFENRHSFTSVSRAFINVNVPSGIMNTSLKDAIVGMNDSLTPQRHIFLTKNTENESSDKLCLFWRKGRMEYDTYIQRIAFNEPGSPMYFRWPNYIRQTYGTDWLNPDLPSEYVGRISQTENGFQLNWPIKEGQSGGPFFNTFFRLAPVGNEREAEKLVAAERNMINMSITGGILYGYRPGMDDGVKKPIYQTVINYHRKYFVNGLPSSDGYNDQEGCYEVRKTGRSPLTVQLPADAMQRTIRIKVICLTGHGAVIGKLDGKEIQLQLSSDGGIADDPEAPITEEPESPATTALVSVELSAKSQVLTIDEVDGIQLVYQVRDPRRNFLVYSTKTGPRWSALHLSLKDVRARHLRMHGKQDWAIGLDFMHWFSDGSCSPERMLDQLRDFKIIKNGPEAIEFRITSNNINEGAQSEYDVRIDANSPTLHADINATFTVLDQYPFREIQFYDVFPFRGVDPKDWWYNNVLWLKPDGKWKTFDPVQTVFKGDTTIEKIAGKGFFGFYSSDRGNMFVLVKNVSPELPASYVLCSNYVDYHMSVPLHHPPTATGPKEKGYVLKVSFELALWGDKSLTGQQMINIGNKSLQQGTLVFPVNNR